MKKIILSTIIFIASTVTMISCKKNDINTPANSASVVSSDPSLSIFAAIVARSGDATIVNSSNTIIAPVDSAFISAGITSTTIPSLSVAACDSIVKYYIISSTLSFNGTPNTETSLTSDLGAAIDADSTTAQLYFNGATTTSLTPTIAGTTSIYKINKFFNVPVNSIAQVATADTSLSLFNEALIRTNLGTTLSGGAYTVFMPTNTAFINAGYPNIASIDAADINVLTQLLLYHVVINNLFTNDLSSQSSLTMLQNGTVQLINTNGNVQLVGNSDPSVPANIISNGQLVNNDIWVYKIDNLLLP